MINDEKGKPLHDKATRGEKLSEQEKLKLEDWYAHQDQLELETFQSPSPGNFLSDLQAQVDSAIAQLVKLSNRIQQITAENEQLRSENASLLDQFSQRFG